MPIQTTAQQTEAKLQLSPRETLGAIHELYKTSAIPKKFNLLLQGRVGGGKTTVASTAPKPILFHAFDPNVTTVLRSKIDGTTILCDPRFVGDDIRNPTLFDAWVKEIQRLEAAGIFNSIATYCIDSGTVWVRSLVNKILKGSPGMKKGGSKRERVKNDFGLPEMEMDDYDTLLNALWDILGRLTALPCNFILTVHFESHVNDMGSVIQRIAIPGSSRDKAPILFDELWRAVSKSVPVDTAHPTGTSYEVQTVTDAGFECRTCLGAGGKLLKYEQPDIKTILKKCGWPSEDKVL